MKNPAFKQLDPEYWTEAYFPLKKNSIIDLSQSLTYISAESEVTKGMFRTQSMIYDGAF